MKTSLEAEEWEELSNTPLPQERHCNGLGLWPWQRKYKVKVVSDRLTVWITARGTCFSSLLSSFLRKDICEWLERRKGRSQTRISKDIERTCLLWSALISQQEVYPQTSLGVPPIKDPPT